MDKNVTRDMKDQIWFKGFRLYYIFIDWKSPVYGQDKKYMYCYHDKTQQDLYWRDGESLYRKYAYRIYS
jgi:hypothetical protein